MDNYYETKSTSAGDNQNLPEKDQPEIPETPTTKTFFDLKTVLIAIAVFVFVASASARLFYYLKNKKTKNNTTTPTETTINLLPTPVGTATTAASNKEENKEASKETASTSSQTSGKESKSQSQEKKHEETVAIKYDSLEINTIAPDSGAPIAGNNPFYIALTTNNPSIAYYESVEYIHKDGTVSNIAGSAGENSYSQSIIVAVPNDANAQTIKVKLIIKDEFNQILTKNLTYRVL